MCLCILPQIIQPTPLAQPVYKVSTISPIVGIFCYYKGVGARNPHFHSISLHPMRKIEQQMNRAISNKVDWNSSNTRVEYNNNTNCSTIVLHRTAIAVYDHNTQAVKLNTGGWHSNTTKSRLNAILSEVKYGCRVFQKQFDWYLSTNNQTVDFWDGMILSHNLEIV